MMRQLTKQEIQQSVSVFQHESRSSAQYIAFESDKPPTKAVVLSYDNTAPPSYKYSIHVLNSEQERKITVSDPNDYKSFLSPAVQIIIKNENSLCGGTSNESKGTISSAFNFKERRGFESAVADLVNAGFLPSNALSILKPPMLQSMLNVISTSRDDSKVSESKQNTAASSSQKQATL